MSTADRLAALSNWIDTSPPNAARDPEAVTWGRISKVAEECGEVIATFIGVTGHNPRKGVTHDIDDVVEELLDVAVTALCAVEHLTGGNAESVDRLDDKVQRVAVRAGLEAEDGQDNPGHQEIWNPDGRLADGRLQTAVVPKMQLVLCVTRRAYEDWCTEQQLNPSDTHRVRRVTGSHQLQGVHGPRVQIVRLANWQVSVPRGDRQAMEQAIEFIEAGI